MLAEAVHVGTEGVGTVARAGLARTARRLRCCFEAWIAAAVRNSVVFCGVKLDGRIAPVGEERKPEGKSTKAVGKSSGDPSLLFVPALDTWKL
jgi:hypothetical protein